MIDKINDYYQLSCDICGETAGDLLDDFYDAVDFKKDNGWKSQKAKGEWQDVCPDCQGEGK